MFIIQWKLWLLNRNLEDSFIIYCNKQKWFLKYSEKYVLINIGAKYLEQENNKHMNTAFYSMQIQVDWKDKKWET